MDYLAEMNKLVDEYFAYDFGDIPGKNEAIKDFKVRADQLIQQAHEEDADFETLKELFEYKQRLSIAHAVSTTKIIANRLLFNARNKWRGSKKKSLLMKKELELFEKGINPKRRGNRQNVDRREANFIVVCRDEGFSYEEIAELLNRSKSTVHEVDERERERDKEFTSDEEAEKDFEDYLETLKQPYKDFVKDPNSKGLVIW